MWRCFGALERISVKRKVQVLRRLLETEQKLQSHHFWVLARLAARRLFHGPEDAVIPAEKIEPFLPTLFTLAGRTNAPRLALLSVANVCRLTGLRALDVNDALRKEAAALLQKRSAPDEWQEQLFTVKSESRDYQTELVGDTLPLGLVLAGD